MSDRRWGFTLFEVMAAVAVLGFAVTMLARGAIAGMGYEGDASRRLAASLIADRALFEVESAFALGAVPEVGRQESETEDEFRLAVEVAPLDPAALGIGALFASDPAAADPAQAPAAQGNAPTLLLVSVRVAWTEGLAEQAVTRTTFAFDATAAAAALGSEQEGEAGGASATATPEAPAGRARSTPRRNPGRFRDRQDDAVEEP